MKLLLDEMYSHSVAEQLRRHGLDAIAVSEVDWLRSKPDHAILEWGTGEDRSVVTENLKDFVAPAVRRGTQDREHAGIVLSPNARFPRGQRSYPGSLITALRGFVADPPVTGQSWVWWLT